MTSESGNSRYKGIDRIFLPVAILLYLYFLIWNALAILTTDHAAMTSKYHSYNPQLAMLTPL